MALKVLCLLLGFLAIVQLSSCISAPDVASVARVDGVPNCNDGWGCLNPCRAGAAGSGIYYRCVLTWGLRYATETRLCTDLRRDLKCWWRRNICF